MENEDQIFDIEQKLSGNLLACFYSSYALNRELMSDLQKAFIYHQKALDEWQKSQEQGFILLSLKHILNLADDLNLKTKTINNYKYQFQQIIQSDQYKGIDEENLFKDSKIKLSCVKEITGCLKKLEDGILTNHEMSINKKNMQKDEKKLNNEFFWQRALRLKLQKSIRLSRDLISQCDSQEEKDTIKQGVMQMQETQKLLLQENPPIVENKIKNLQYTVDAVKEYKYSLEKMNKICKHLLSKQFFYKINVPDKSIKKQSSVVVKEQVQMKKIPSVQRINLLAEAFKVALKGDYVQKIHSTSNGRAKKFIKLCADGQLKWTNKDTDINNPKKCQIINFADINGLLYGKRSKTLRKPYNDKIDPDLCFSLLLKERTWDLEITPENISKWVLVLINEIKKYNPKAYIPTLGKFYWLKLKYTMQAILQQTFKKQICLTFCQLVLICRQQKIF